MRYYVCKTMRLAEYFVSLGFKIQKVQQDRNNPKYNVWLFEDTIEFRVALSNYRK